MTATLSQHMCLLLVLLALSLTARGASYSLTDNWVGETFLHAFSWKAIVDPTHGRVNYLSKRDSIDLNLTYACSDRL
jgi:hypothetical protein